MMPALRCGPEEAYRRVAVEACIRGGAARDITLLCFEQLAGELVRAERADRRGDREARSAALTRAHGALTALEMGLDKAHPLAAPLGHLYGAARAVIIKALVRFEAAGLRQVRLDFAELGEALRAASAAR